MARKAAPPLVKQVYNPKQREEVQKTEVNPESPTGQDIIQIGSMDVPIGEDGKRPIVPNNKVVTSTPEVAANDHEASGSSSNSKYFLPRWCPPGLALTQRRKLQCLRFQEKREKELKKQRDKAFNQYRPMVPQGKEWRIKTSSEPAPVGPVEESVRPVTPVRSVDVDGQIDDPETLPDFSSLVPMVCDDKSASDLAPEDDEELVDYSSSPERMNLDINVIHMSMDGYVLSEEDVAHLDFGPKEAIFQKPKSTENHLKALYMKGHINGKPISRMLVDGGAIVNLMLYSLFKILGGSDDALIKTNKTVSGVGGGEPMGAKGVISMELTVGSKTLAMAFFVAQTQGKFSLIIGRDWIHANQCLPSTLHQFLIQWVGDEVEIVLGDASAWVAVADSSTMDNHENLKCLTSLDLSNLKLIDSTKDGFATVVMKPIVDQARTSLTICWIQIWSSCNRDESTIGRIRTICVRPSKTLMI
jgi:hypothetical protein